jgi:phospholipid transport system substrate-binding protein
MIRHKKLASKRLFAFALYFKRARLFLACAMMFLVGSQTSFAGTSQIDSANKLVTQMMVEVESILAKDLNDDMARRENVSALFDRYFDLPTIAKFSAGPYWRAADADQKTAYESAMRDVIIGTVVRNFDQLSGLKFTATDSQAKGKQLVLVNGTFTDINQQQPPIAVGWRVITADNTPPLILDVEIENISMLVTQKQENIAIIRKNEGQFAVLIDAMIKRSQANN